MSLSSKHGIESERTCSEMMLEVCQAVKLKYVFEDAEQKYKMELKRLRMSRQSK